MRESTLHSLFLLATCVHYKQAQQTGRSQSLWHLTWPFMTKVITAVCVCCAWMVLPLPFSFFVDNRPGTQKSVFFLSSAKLITPDLIHKKLHESKDNDIFL